METTGCPIKEAPKLVSKYMEIGRTPLFRNNPEANTIFNKRYGFRDTIDNVTFGSKAEESYEIMRNMDDSARRMFVSDIKDCTRQIATAMESVQGTNKGYQALYVSDMMSYMGKYDKKLIDNIRYLEDLFMKKGYTPYKVFASMNTKEGLTDIYNNIKGSLRYAFLLHEGVNAGNITNRLMDFGKANGMTESTAKRFTDDMLGSPLLAKERQQWIGAMKSMYSFMKFSIIAPISGTFNLLNNTLLGSMMFLSKKRGLEGMMKSDAVDYLIKDEGFLASEGRASNIVDSRYDQDGKNFFNRAMDKVFSVIPNSTMGAKLRTVLQGGIHNVRDLIVENSAKRLSIVEALSKNGINKNNIDLFIDNVKKGNISPDFLLKLRGDAALNWKQFFTTGEISSLNRNRFSRMWYINTLQNYVINRSDDVWSGIRKAYLDFKANPKRVRGDFAEYLKYENPELKGLLTNMLLCAKAGIYINAMTEGMPGETEEDRVWKYVRNMSDYLSSFTSNFMYRFITAPIRGAQKYYEYTEATGQKEDFIEGVNVAFLSTLSEITSQLFREGKVLNILSDTAIGYLKTGSIDFASAIAGDDIDKITSGMGRFSLLPGQDNFGQKGISGGQDMIGRMTFSYPEFNDAAGKAQRIKDIGTVEGMINDTKRAWLNLLNNIPLVQSIYKGSERSITGQYTNASWKILQDEINTNPTMKKIWEGEFPDELLNNEDIVNNLYSELISHSYYGKKLGTEGEHVVSEYGLTKQEEKVFVQNIAEGLGISLEDLESILKSNRDKSYLVKVLAAAEANKPGSSKIVLGYLANDELYNMKLSRFGKGFSNVDIDPGVENEMRKQVVSKYYPYMEFADKTSRYKLAREYLSSSKPEIFGSLKSDSVLTGFVNTLGFTDMIMYNEARMGDVDAGYVKNIFNVAAKYIKDPGLRVKLVTNTLNTISSLDATPSQKNLMRLGVLTANIDTYDKLKKDSIMGVMYADDINKFENTIRGVNETLNHVGISGIESGMNDLAKKQYYGSTYKKYVPNQYSSGNQKVQQQFQDGVNRVYNPAQYGRPVQRYSTTSSDIIYPRIAFPKFYSLYYKVYDDTYKAVSEDITKQSGRKYPAESIEGLKFNKPSYRKTRKYTSTGTKFPKAKAKYKSKGVNRQLPGG